MSLIKTSVTSVWLCVLSLLSTAALAMPENITKGEIAVIPEFCKDAQIFNPGLGSTLEQSARDSPRVAHWVSVMGTSFWAIHHYCWALVSLHRAKSAGVTPQVRAHLNSTAIDDMNYVIRYSKPDMALLPEIYYYIGESRAFLKNPGAAVENFNKSRELKPDYWPPYLGHAKILEKAGLTAQAKKVLEEGLRLMPTERVLQVPFVRLGGRLADIVPMPAPAYDAAAPGPATAASAPG